MAMRRKMSKWKSLKEFQAELLRIERTTIGNFRSIHPFQLDQAKRGCSRLSMALIIGLHLLHSFVKHLLASSPPHLNLYASNHAALPHNRSTLSK